MNTMRTVRKIRVKTIPFSFIFLNIVSPSYLDKIRDRFLPIMNVITEIDAASSKNADPKMEKSPVLTVETVCGWVFPEEVLF